MSYYILERVLIGANGTRVSKILGLFDDQATAVKAQAEQNAAVGGLLRAPVHLSANQMTPIARILDDFGLVGIDHLILEIDVQGAILAPQSKKIILATS